MKNKKSLMAIIALVLVLVVGSTFAYFYTTADFENQFNLGKYNVVIKEVFEPPEDWAPGDTTPKLITAKNEGQVPAVVRISYTETWTDEDGQTINSNDIPNNAVIINFTTPSNWEYDSNDGYYYYKNILDAGDETDSLIQSVTLNSNLVGSVCVDGNGESTCHDNMKGLAGANYKLTFNIEIIQSDLYQSTWNTNHVIGGLVELVSLPSGRTKDNLQVGDEICINGDTTECYNFIGYDGNNIKMLSKWNLKVGDIYEIRNYTMVGIGRYSSSDEGYGLQSSEARGAVVSGTWNGTMPFSSAAYWNDGNNLNSIYGNNWDNNNIYDTLYSAAPDFNDSGYHTAGYSIAYYVRNYENTLEGYGVTLKGARLLTYSEAVALGCDDSTQLCPTDGFVSNTTYWLGSANSNNFVWLIDSGGNFLNGEFYDFSSGVRPVIIIDKNDI